MNSRYFHWLRAAGWLLLLYYLWPIALLNRWESMLIAFAAVELVPMCLSLLRQPAPAWYPLVSFPFALTMALEGPWWLVVPYLLVSIFFTWKAFVALVSLPERPLAGWVRLFALGYWATGALWALLHKVQYQPFGFDPVIVTLTAAHFHLAGLTLSSLVYAHLTFQSTFLTRLLGSMSLAGMPLVALGITLTRLGYAPLLEQLAALFFVGYAVVFLGLQWGKSCQKSQPYKSRAGWFFGSLCLAGGMLLATLYALRFQFPLEWINIPNLKYWHGTLNTLGFGWCSLWAWEYVLHSDKPL